MIPIYEPALLSLFNPAATLFVPQIQFGLFVFVLALFVGFELIHKVPQLLHTPLLSSINGISGVAVVSALAIVGTFGGYEGNWFANLLAFLAIAFAAFNVVGGFALTERMLRTFRSS